MLLKSILEYSWKAQTLINNLISMSKQIWQLYFNFQKLKFHENQQKNKIWKSKRALNLFLEDSLWRHSCCWREKSSLSDLFQHANAYRTDGQTATMDMLCRHVYKSLVSTLHHFSAQKLFKELQKKKRQKCLILRAPWSGDVHFCPI